MRLLQALGEALLMRRARAPSGGPDPLPGRITGLPEEMREETFSFYLASTESERKSLSG